jgi:hypothetical protein
MELHYRRPLVRKGDTPLMTIDGADILGKCRKYPVLVEILDIDGVVDIVCRAYVLEVKKAYAFSWDEILPNIRTVLEKYL